MICVIQFKDLMNVSANLPIKNVCASSRERTSGQTPLCTEKMGFATTNII